MSASPLPDAEAVIAEIRAFNRFYTRLVGALDEGLLRSPWSLLECRILYELGSGGWTTAAALGAELDMDAGYLSRLLKKLREAGLVEAAASAADARAQDLSLTPEGTAAYGRLDAASRADVAALLAPLPGPDAQALVAAMRRIRALLDPAAPKAPVVVRPHRVGEIGHVVGRQGALYHEEHGWDATFEGFVAEIAGSFARAHDPRREGCFVADRDGAVLGAAFVVDAGDGIARLRMLYVEPAARGEGVGRRLVETCIGFARQAGYRRMTLWTNDILHAARRLYEAAGFRLVSEERHRSFGRDLVGQTWDLDLLGSGGAHEALHDGVSRAS
jgi:DNA-binding MarR family transcriptional regulator/GNAT superfamily N-acetyltransferase